MAQSIRCTPDVHACFDYAVRMTEVTSKRAVFDDALYIFNALSQGVSKEGSHALRDRNKNIKFFSLLMTRNGYDVLQRAGAEGLTSIRNTQDQDFNFSITSVVLDAARLSTKDLELKNNSAKVAFIITCYAAMINEARKGSTFIRPNADGGIKEIVPMSFKSAREFPMRG